MKPDLCKLQLLSDQNKSLCSSLGAHSLITLIVIDSLTSAYLKTLSLMVSLLSNTCFIEMWLVFSPFFLIFLCNWLCLWHKCLSTRRRESVMRVSPTRVKTAESASRSLTAPPHSAPVLRASPATSVSTVSALSARSTSLHDKSFYYPIWPCHALIQNIRTFFFFFSLAWPDLSTSPPHIPIVTNLTTLKVAIQYWWCLYFLHWAEFEEK